MLMNIFPRRLIISCLVSVAAVTMTALAQESASAPPTSAPAGTRPQPTMQQRLDRLCEQLEQQRQDLHIPGFALAIVKNDQVILTKGFGVSDVEKNTPVTPETVFAIGSSSKAFTAALVAMMIDEGKMSLDDPVRKHLPQFHLSDKDADAQMTIRDLLCHRCGLERTDLVWASGQASRDEILAAIATAEPTAKFREKFQYQNVMFMAAGMAAANAAGLNGDWDAMVAQRIFTPLGMSITNTSIKESQANPHLSLGYQWDEDKKEFKQLPMRDLHPIAPAGAINSNVVDMAQWLRLQLGKGEIDGKVLIKPERFDEMRHKEIDVAAGAGIGYGLGWMLHDWQGRHVVEHGGNIDGFGAQVTLVPEENLGYVLLTNVTATPLQSMSINLVCDALLGEWKETPDAPLDPSTVEKYLGKYHFDVLKNDVTVLMKDGKLAVDVPGQMVYALKSPNAEGKWFFEMTDQIAVSFEKDSTGEVANMIFYQSGLRMECPKDGVVPTVEIGLDDAQKYIGKYHDPKNNIDVTVLHRNGRLAIDVPNQLVFDLRLPDADGKWQFRAVDGIAVRFETDASGAVTGMTHFQSGKEMLLPRQPEAAAAAKVPTVEEMLALHERGTGSGDVASLGNVRLTAKVDMRNQGLRDVRLTVLMHGVERFTQNIDMGKFGWIKLGLDGDAGWTDSIFEPGDVVPKSTARLMRLQNPLLPAADWRSVFDKVEIIRMDKVDDRDVVVMELSAPESVRCTAFVDRENGRPLKFVYQIPVPNVGSIETTETFSDWREIGGVMIPWQWESDSAIFGKTTVTVQNVETKIDLPPDAFAMPKR